MKVLVLVVECDVVLILAGPFGLVDGDGLRFGNFRGIAQLVHLHTPMICRYIDEGVGRGGMGLFLIGGH